MNSRIAYKLSRVFLGVALVIPVLTASADGVSDARQQQASYADLKQQAMADEPISGNTPEELRLQSNRQSMAIHGEMRRQSAAAKDAAVRKEAARLVMERAADN